MTNAPSPTDAAAHPPVAPPRSTASNHHDATALLDDRGKPVILADFATLHDAVHENKPPFPWQRVLAWTIVSFISAWFILSTANAISIQFPLGILGLLVFVLPADAWRRRGSAITARHHRIASATLARTARCGRCGFSLHGLNSDADGCVECPECGAAWNRERWAASPTNAHTLAAQCIAANSEVGTTDDRGAFIHKPLRWEPEWCGGIIDRYARKQIAPAHWTAFREFHAICKAKLHRLYVRAALWALSGTCGGMIILGFTGSDLPGGLSYVVVALLGVMAMVVLTALVHGSIDTRGLALKHSLCPSCGELLDLNQPRQFDGCIQCAKCAAAWKLDADATPPAPASSPNAAALGQVHVGPTSA